MSRGTARCRDGNTILIHRRVEPRKCRVDVMGSWCQYEAFDSSIAMFLMSKRCLGSGRIVIVKIIVIGSIHDATKCNSISNEIPKKVYERNLQCRHQSKNKRKERAQRGGKKKGRNRRVSQRFLKNQTTTRRIRIELAHSQSCMHMKVDPHSAVAVRQS